MSLETTAEVEDEDFVDELKPGTKLMLGQYTIEGFLAAGGFGITYLAKDSLDRRVVVKECFPGSFCRRQNTSVTPRSRAHQNELKSIVRLFSQEAMSLAKTKHPNIVGVHQVFEENNTAYMALDYVHGRDLLEILTEDPGSLTPMRIQGYLTKILDAIKHIHKLGMLHRDISPDNIIINAEGEPILIDFGAARESSNERVTRMLSALRVVKDGYSPQEFYIAGSDQTPSCDLYSLAASFYHIITKELPPDSQWRLSACAAGDDDPYVSLGDKSNDYSPRFVAALDKAMSILPRDRMQSAEEWLDALKDGTPIAAPATSNPVKPTAAKQEKKSFMPILLGTTALAAAAGAGFFYVSTQEVETPSNSVVGEEVAVAPEAPVAIETPEEAPIAPVETVEVIEPEPSLPVELATPIEVEPEAEPAPAEAVAPVTEVAKAEEIAPATEEPALVELPTVEDVAIEVSEPPLPAVEETTDFEVPPVILALPEPMVAPQPRPFRDADETVANIEADLPVIDTVAPEAPEEITAVTELEEAPAPAEEVEPEAVAEAEPAPTVVAEAEPETAPAQQVEPGSALDFFLNMSTSEPDLVSAGPRRNTALAAPQAPAQAVTSAPAVASASTPAPAAVETAPASPAVIRDTVLTRFIPVLPFSLSPWQQGVISSVQDEAPDWLEQNSRIVSVNGTPVSNNDDIRRAIDAAAPQDGAGSFGVIIAFDSGLNTAVTERSLTVSTEKHVQLLNGMRFVSRDTGAGWTTEVAEVRGNSNFKVGDTLVSYVSTWEDLNGPDTLETILTRELSNGTSSFSFAVSRNGEIWIEAFNLASLN